MKKEYPNYKKFLKREGSKFISYLDTIEEKLSSKDKKAINNFLNYCKINSKSETARITRKRTILQIYDVMEKPLVSVTLKDLRDFLIVLNESKLASSTQNDIKTLLKRFLRWYYKDWSEKFGDFRDIKMKDERNHEKIHPDAMLTNEEIEKLIRKAENLKYRALIMLTFESAGRPEEILKLKWKDINFEDEKVKLYSIKTNRSRSNELKKAIIHLRRYKQEYPFPNVNDEDFVFPSPQDRNKKISGTSFSMYFKQLGERAGVKKHVWPYLLRHTRLTPLLQILSPKAYVQFSGHALETGMYYYGHLSESKLSAEILEKVYHVKEVTAKREELEIEIKNLKKDISKQNKKFEKEINNLKEFVMNANENERDFFIVNNTPDKKVISLKA